jgi:hypothetical protein
MIHIKSILEKNAEFLNVIPNGTLVATGLLMVNSSVKAKTDRIFQFVYIYIYIYIYLFIYLHTHTHTQRICEATLLRCL